MWYIPPRGPSYSGSPVAVVLPVAVPEPVLAERVDALGGATGIGVAAGAPPQTEHAEYFAFASLRVIGIELCRRYWQPAQ